MKQHIAVTALVLLAPLACKPAKKAVPSAFESLNDDLHYCGTTKGLYLTAGELESALDDSDPTRAIEIVAPSENAKPVGGEATSASAKTSSAAATPSNIAKWQSEAVVLRQKLGELRRLEAELTAAGSSASEAKIKEALALEARLTATIDAQRRYLRGELILPDLPGFTTIDLGTPRNVIDARLRVHTNLTAAQQMPGRALSAPPANGGMPLDPLQKAYIQKTPSPPAMLPTLRSKTPNPADFPSRTSVIGGFFKAKLNLGAASEACVRLDR